MAGIKHSVTSDGRYLVLKGKLWRLGNPDVERRETARLVKAPMDARRAVKDAKGAGNRDAEFEAHRRVDEAGRARPRLVDDGAPDFNRHAVKNTPYAGRYSKAAIRLICRDATILQASGPGDACGGRQVP